MPDPNWESNPGPLVSEVSLKTSRKIGHPNYNHLMSDKVGIVNSEMVSICFL